MVAEETMRLFEASICLKDLKSGDVVSEQQVEAIHLIAGPFIEAARKMKVVVYSTSFHEGKAYTTKDGKPTDDVSISGMETGKFQ